MELRLYKGFRDPIYPHKTKEELLKLKKNGIEAKLESAGWVFYGDNYASLQLSSFLEITKALNQLVDWGIYSVVIMGMNHRELKDNRNILEKIRS